jgi:hypothetical protein
MCFQASILFFKYTLEYKGRFSLKAIHGTCCVFVYLCMEQNRGIRDLAELRDDVLLGVELAMCRSSA